MTALFEALEGEPEESEEPYESATLLNSANREDHVPENLGVIVHPFPEALEGEPEEEESATLLNGAEREDRDTPESLGVIVHPVPDELS